MNLRFFAPRPGGMEQGGISSLHPLAFNNPDGVAAWHHKGVLFLCVSVVQMRFQG